jgi:alpha-beta hydrolase superfamily lysophospholipase
MGAFYRLAGAAFDASKIAVPTLVMRGDSDRLCGRKDNQKLMADLGSKEKRFVEIERAGHMIQYEKSNAASYNAIANLLDGRE